ncbi:hypothetical protein GLAREA_07967 [Glarea lozoyensis ATCC 20868]|uniref:Rhodopsin domain-containing protein n=1 Tax=Glarea lozoyensis (strain ATCC 20868 / MF5171) TaxID=1116229 RepID=S3CBZ8_GLAL2|nr:uncharacterized protein GLAREA_07967 [Glarea lozoyensis ATCC 20868]EPE24117.1 hypothetical protein GLAREA_07967 [Glarea lozoyensis ATCC 20868]
MASLMDLDPSMFPAFAAFPAGLPPKGVTANFENPYTLAPLVYSMGALFVFIMMCFVAARFYHKAVLIKRFTWDDLTCVLAALGVIEQLLTASMICHFGVGTHQWNLKVGNLIRTDFLMWGTAFVVGSLPTMLFAKLTFFILYMQIFRPRTHLVRWIWGGAAITTGFYVATAICQFYYYIPGPGQTWLTTIKIAPNTPSSTVGIVAACFNIFSDFYLFFIATIGIWQLQMPKERRLGIIGIFSTGLLACLVSIVGLVFRLRSKAGKDGSWELLPPALLCIIELSVGVSCSCMPSIGGLTKHYSKQISGLAAYFTFLRRRTYGKGSSLDERSDEYNSASRKGGASYGIREPDAWREDAELAQLQPVQISAFDNRDKGWQPKEDGIHVREEFHLKDERR